MTSRPGFCARICEGAHTVLYGVRREVYPSPVRGSIVGRALLSLTIAGAVLAAAFSAPSAFAQSEETTEPSPPTATASPADVELARELADAGDVEAAIAAYTAYVESGAQEERSAVLMELARLLIADGQPAAAARHLDAYLFEAPPNRNVRDAQFMLAEALRRSGKWDSALSLYNAYTETEEPLEAYARMGRAESLARLGFVADASSEAEAVLEGGLPASVKVQLVRAMAEAFEASGDRGLAIVWYGRLAAEGSPAEQAHALWRSGVLKVQSNDDGWRSDILAVIQRYPATYPALQAVNAFIDLRGAIDGYYFGLVHYQHGEDQKARAIFDDIVAGPASPNAARAAYYLAAIDERAGETDAAIAGYARVREIDSDIELADDALWWRGRLLEQEGRVEEAAEDYERLASQFASSERGREARFRLALLDYDAGRFEQAQDAYAEVASDTTGEVRDRALLWRGKSLLALGDEDAAAEVLRRLSVASPDDYFGLRARALLGETERSIDEGEVDGSSSTDWTAISAWLDASQESETASPAAPSGAQQHLGMGDDLAAAGLLLTADAERALALELAGSDADELLRLARRFEGGTHMSARASARLLAAVDEEVLSDAPEDLWRLAYPAPYTEQLLDATDESDAPTLLLLAMIRQESFFDRLAGSPAGALGLTQIIEPTGEAIARELEVDDFEMEDLYQPAVSLRFGAHYLASQLEAFDGNFYHALAAYNGGPGNAERWAAGSGGDVDRFFEEIDFAETRLYVELVSENLARYRQVYAGLDAPGLPG
jgi:soluble lytic murein transglycosylase